MFYSVQEVSSILQVTRATVYNKIDKMKDLNKHVKIKDRVKYIDDEGLELLKVSMNKQDQCQKESKPEEKIIENIDSSRVVGDYTTIQKLIETLERQLEIKDRQLESKDEQLQAKDRQLETLAKLNENNQILLKQVQDKVFLLESGNDKKEDVSEPEKSKVHFALLMQSMKQMEEKINSLESAASKKYWFQFWKN